MKSKIPVKMAQPSSSTKQNFSIDKLEMTATESDMAKNDESYQTLKSPTSIASSKVFSESNRGSEYETLDFKQEQYLRNRNPIPIQSRSATSEKLRITESSYNNNTITQPENSLTLYNYGQRQYSQFPINLVQDKVLKKIFSFLNHSDLVQCRAVQRRWKKILSRDKNFLEKTVYVVNIVKSYNVATSSLIYNDLTIYAQMPYLHGRFQYIDSNFLKEPRKFVLKNSDNEKYVPEGKFLKTLSSLEFRNCLLCWHTVKKMLIRATVVETLIISDCYILEDLNPPTIQHTTEFEEFNAGNAIFAMKHLEIYEIRCLSNVTSILKKFIGYGNQALACLKITYYPPAERGSTRDDIKSDSADFCRELKTLISNCASSLQTLCLDVQHEQTLNFIGYHVCKHLQALGPRLDLTEFRLTPSLACWVHKPGLMPTMGIAMTMKDMTNGDGQKCLITAAAAMARFLESQKNLKILALPCIEHPEAFSSCFHTVLTRLPAAPTIEYLAVPSAGFLPLNLLHVFPNLKALQVGGTCCQDSTSGWEIFQYYTKEQLVNTASADTPDEANQDGAIVRREFAVMTPQPILAITQTDNDFYERLEMMKKMEELYLTTTFIPKNFKIVMSRLINLTTLNVSSGPDSPVIRDDDLQACILHLKQLHNLLIGCADELTDYGISGIPNEYCSATFKNQRYQKDGVYENVWSSEKVTGRPLSDLKGLRKLVLKGKNEFTDIGIAYGLAFQELKCCHLPYSDYVTSWGIERFNVMNPSLESFGLCGVSELTKDAFLSSRRTHTRLGKGDASRTGYYSEHVSGIDNFSLVLATPETVKALLASVTEKVQTAYRACTAYNYEVEAVDRHIPEMSRFL